MTRELLQVVPAVVEAPRILGVTTRLRFVVTGAGRSGTGYIARILTAAGVPTGHEDWFGPVPGLRGPETVTRATIWMKLKAPGSRFRVELRRRRGGLVGDSSWLAVPHLPRFRGLVYLQVRHPLKVIGSLVGMDFFGSRHAQDPFRRYAEHHFEVTGDVLADSARFWVECNRRALPYAHRIWRLEDVNASLVGQILRDLDVPDPSERAALAIRCVSPVNTAVERGYAPVELAWKDLPERLRTRVAGLARCLGYDVEGMASVAVPIIGAAVETEAVRKTCSSPQRAPEKGT